MALRFHLNEGYMKGQWEHGLYVQALGTVYMEAYTKGGIIRSTFLFAQTMILIKKAAQ